MDKSYEERMKAGPYRCETDETGERGVHDACGILDSYAFALAREMDAERAAKDAEIARLKAALEARKAEAKEYAEELVRIRDSNIMDQDGIGHAWGEWMQAIADESLQRGAVIRANATEAARAASETP